MPASDTSASSVAAPASVNGSEGSTPNRTPRASPAETDGRGNSKGKRYLLPSAWRPRPHDLAHHAIGRTRRAPSGSRSRGSVSVTAYDITP